MNFLDMSLALNMPVLDFASLFAWSSRVEFGLKLTCSQACRSLLLGSSILRTDTTSRILGTDWFSSGLCILRTDGFRILRRQTCSIPWCWPRVVLQSPHSFGWSDLGLRLGFFFLSRFRQLVIFFE